MLSFKNCEKKKTETRIEIKKKTKKEIREAYVDQNRICYALFSCHFVYTLTKRSP